MLDDKLETFYVRKEVDEKPPQEELFYYEIRTKDDEGKEPFILEQAVLTNYFGTVGLNEPLHLEHDDFIELSDKDKNILKKIKNVLY